jgi:hypothetical protein
MKVCSILDCNSKHLANGLCSKHYYRQKRGQPVLGRTRFTRRPAIVKDNVVMLELGNNKGFTKIDKKYQYLDRHNWSLSHDGYPVSGIDGKIIKLHHVIVGKPKIGEVIDHINRDKLDNRVENLRHTTQLVNANNAGMFNTNTSGHKGVCWDKQNKKWYAQSNFNGKHQFGGYYKTKEEAILARQKLEDNYNTSQ